MEKEKPEQSAIESQWGKFTHAQLMFIFSAITACIGLPALLLFHLDEKLFMEIEIGKLLLLCFGTSAPVLFSMFGYAWLDGEISGKRQKTSALIHMAKPLPLCFICFALSCLRLASRQTWGSNHCFCCPWYSRWRHHI